MLTTDSLLVNDTIMYRELHESLVDHSFEARVPRDVVGAVADVLTLARFNARSFNDVLDEVTQILLKDKDVASAHTGDEVAEMAYGMIQRIHEISAFSQLIHSTRFFS